MEVLLDRLRRLRGGRADLAAAGLGLVSALALPPLHALPALWLAVPGLLALIDGTGRPAVAFRRGFLFALLHHMVGLYWVTEAILFEAARFWWLVPLAVPALLQTVRITLVQLIGLATLAALIGAGGLGTFIFQGLGQTANDLVLLGALSAIGLALVADLALRGLAHLAAPRGAA
jgi:ABC-type proline/glycine betaine transport system permease subunit